MKNKLINFVLSFISFLVLWIGLWFILGAILGTGIISIFYEDPLLYNQEQILKYGWIIMFIFSIVILVFFREKLLYYKNKKWNFKIANFFKYFLIFLWIFLIIFIIFWNSMKSSITKYNMEKISWEKMSDEKFDAITNPNSFSNFCKKNNSEILENWNTIIPKKYCIIDWKECWEYEYKDNLCGTELEKIEQNK